MRRAPSLALLLALVAALVAAGAQAKPTPKKPPPATALRLFTQNLYVGFDVKRLLDASGTDMAGFVAVATAAFQAVQASDPPDRMAAVAAEIAARKPDLVGLQEAASYSTGANGSYDFVQLILAALKKKGLTYKTVAASVNADVAAPIAGGGDIVRFRDRDVLLVRTGKGAKVLTITHAGDGHFADPRVVITPTGPVPFPRGWTWADVRAGKEAYLIVNTHLEAFDDARQAEQAHQLVAGLAHSKLPAVVMGDLNSNAGPAGSNRTEAYADLIAAGFADAWPRVHPNDPGFTCCEQPDLRNEAPQLQQRIDLVLTRGALTPIGATVVGADSSARTAGGLWPSDHAGLVVTLRLR